MLRSRHWTTPSAWWLGLPAAAVVAIAVEVPLRSSGETAAPLPRVTAPRIARVYPHATVYTEPRPLPADITASGMPLEKLGRTRPVQSPPAKSEQGAATAWKIDPSVTQVDEHGVAQRHVEPSAPGWPTAVRPPQPQRRTAETATVADEADHEMGLVTQDAEYGSALPPSDWSIALPAEFGPSMNVPPLGGYGESETHALPREEAVFQEASPPGAAPAAPESRRPHEGAAFSAIPALPTAALHMPVADDVGTRRRFGTPPADALAVLPHVSDAVLREQVGQHLSAGYTLAKRGALYSAKSEFETALRVLAQSQDAAQGTTHRAQQLAAALLAIEEADDFFVTDPRTQAVANLNHIAAAHRTPVLRERALSDATALQAMQAYYAFARSALETSLGEQPLAAEALYGLGKIYATRARQPADHQGRLLGAKALLMYQVATTADGRHHLAANELGVMLARYGQYEEAKRALLQSVALKGLPQSWHNLAVVHQQLGEDQLAQLAEAESRNATAAEQAEPRPLLAAEQADSGLQWIDVEEAMRQATAAAESTPATGRPAPGDRSASQSNSVWNWLPWNTTQR